MRALGPVAEHPDSLPRDVADDANPATRRTTVIGLGTVLVLVGLALIYNVGLASLFHSSLFGEYNLSDPVTIEVPSHAVVSDDVELLRWSTMPEFVPPLDDVRVEGVATGPEALFIGIAPTDAVAEYLDGVAHDEIVEWDSSADDITDVAYVTSEGAADPAAPATEGFWAVSVSGSGGQALDWTIERGEWALVIMNADGSPRVSADVRFGVATLSVLVPIGVVSLVVGLVALVGGTRLVISVPSRPDHRPRWTVRGHPVLPTTVEGIVAVSCAVFALNLFTTGTMFGAPVFLLLAARKGDRSLSLVLPLFASLVVIGLIAIVIYQLAAWAL